jgi:hypothetical protein
MEEDRASGVSTGPCCAESWPSSSPRIRCSSPQIPEHYMAHLSIAHILHSSADVQQQIEFLLENSIQEAKTKLERVKLCDRRGHAAVRHEAHTSTWRSHVSAWIAPAAACMCSCLAVFEDPDFGMCEGRCATKDAARTRSEDLSGIEIGLVLQRHEHGRLRV